MIAQLATRGDRRSFESTLCAMLQVAGSGDFVAGMRQFVRVLTARVSTADARGSVFLHCNGARRACVVARRGGAAASGGERRAARDGAARRHCAAVDAARPLRARALRRRAVGARRAAERRALLLRTRRRALANAAGRVRWRRVSADAHRRFLFSVWRRKRAASGCADGWRTAKTTLRGARSTCCCRRLTRAAPAPATASLRSTTTTRSTR